VDFRTIFDRVPEQFDKWRPRYCDELFVDLVEYAQLDSDKTVLEIGPGTGQATEPVLRTGCSYLAIELSDIFTDLMQSKYRSYNNFQIVNADFEKHVFGNGQFDLVYSAAAFQWIPQDIGYRKVYNLIKSGGAFAMMFIRTDYKTSNEALFAKIQSVYDKHFRPDAEYKCHLDYEARDEYGFVDLECRQYNKNRVLDADDYVSLIGTHSDHISIPEPHKSMFLEGVREAIIEFGDSITLNDTIVLYLARKP